MTKVFVTVDWDFFVDTDLYDFGHRENNFFIETMWNIRLQGRPSYIDTFRVPPSYKKFWTKLKPLNIIPNMIYASESHCYVYSIFASFPADVIINFDSHHDMWNPKVKEDVVTCENWAFKLMKTMKKIKYIWVIPEWIDESRKQVDDDLADRITICSIEDLHLYLPNNPKSYVGHMCRSGSWMPPWLDKDFITLLKLSGAFYSELDEDSPVKRDFIVPSKEEHEEYKKRMRESFERTKLKEVS